MPYASSIQVVNDANGTAYGFLNDNGQLFQCRWDSQAERWVETTAVPGAVGGNALQATYLDNLWAREPGGSNAQGQSWDPGIVLLYRKGQDSQAEICAVFGRWGENGELQWTQEVQLTNDTVNDKEFSLVPAGNGEFVLVSQKQEEVQSLPATLDAVKSGSITSAEVQQALSGVLRPDSDLYTTSYQILNQGSGLAPLLQANPVQSSSTGTTWSTIATLEASAQPPAPAPGLPDGLSGTGTAFSKASLLAGNLRGTGVASSALRSCAPSTTLGATSDLTRGSWEVGKSSNPTTVQTGLLELARWKIGFPALQNPDDDQYDEIDPSKLSIAQRASKFVLDDLSSEKLNVRPVILGSGFYGLTNTGGSLAFRSQAKLSIGLVANDRSLDTGIYAGRKSPAIEAMAKSKERGEGIDRVTIENKLIGRLMGSGAVGSTTYYGNSGNHSPVLLQAREAASLDAGLSYMYSWATYKGTIPTIWSFDASLSNAFGRQWITSVGNGVSPLPQSGGIAEKVIGGIGSSETYLTAATGFVGTGILGKNKAFKDLGYSTNSQLASEKLNGNTKIGLYKNLFNAVVGTSSALINPILLAKNASTYQGSSSLNYQKSSGLFNTSQLELQGKYNGVFNIRATFLNKYNGTTTDQLQGAYSDTFVFDLAVGAFGAYQPVFGLDQTWSSPGTATSSATTTQTLGSTSGTSLAGSSSGRVSGNPGGSIVYAPSQGSNLYWAPATGTHLLNGQNTQALRLQTLLASSTNLMGTSATTLYGNGGSGLNNGTYTNVRLVGVTPGGESDLAEATVVVSGNKITSVVITKGGTYTYLPEYANSPTELVVVPDLLSVNASTGTAIVDAGALAKGEAKAPTIILSSTDTGSWTSAAAAVIQSVQVSNGGSGYAPLDAQSQQVKNLAPYFYSKVGYSVVQGSTPISSLASSNAQTATVTIVDGVITNVSLDQPFICAPPSSSGSYSLVLDLPTGVSPTQPATLTATPTTTAYNNFVDEHSFYTERTAGSAGAQPSTSGVYIADGSNDQAPLLASERGNALSSRVVFVDGNSGISNNTNTYYLNTIQWNSSTNAWQAGISRDVNPSPSLTWKSAEQQFSLARLPVATELPNTSSFGSYKGGDLVAWVEVIDRPVPNSTSETVQDYEAIDYQNFYDNYFNNQQIAFSIHTTSGWATNPFNYIPAGDSIIDNLEISEVPGSTVDAPQVLLTWSETAISAVKGLTPVDSYDPQSGQAPTVIKAALFDPATGTFGTPQTITWASPDAVGIGLKDLNISSMPLVQADGSINQAPAIAWSQNVAVPYEQAVLTSNPYIYLQMSQGQSGVGNYNIGSLGDSPAAVTSASSTGLAFNVAGALGINSDAAIENIDGTGVLSTGIGRVNTFLAPTSNSTGSTTSGVARSPYTIEFWARVPDTGNADGAGLFALGQPSITQGVLPTGWLLTSSFVVDQITYEQALGRGLIDALPTPDTPLSDIYGYAWAVVADGANTTALGGSGGSGLYSNALTINNLQAGTSLSGVKDFLQSYGVTTPLIGTSGVAADTIAEVPATSLEFDNALLNGAPNSSLNNIAVSTDQAVMNGGLVTTTGATWTGDSNLQTLFENLWDYQQKTGRAKVNFDLAPPPTFTASGIIPPLYEQENYGGLGLNFTLTSSTAVSVNGQGQVVFDVGSGTSLLSTVAAEGVTAKSINDGNWHYIVASYLPDYITQTVNNQPVDVPQTTGTATLYIDNALVGQTALSDVFSPDTEASDALLIYLNNGGAIDELALYQQALSGLDLSTPTNPNGDWPVLSSADAAGLLASLGVSVAGLSTSPGVETGAVNLHWKARSVDPNAAENATFYTTYDGTSWNPAQLLNPKAAPVATQPSGSRNTSLQDADLIQINPSDWGEAGFNPGKQQLKSVTVNLLNSSNPSTVVSTYTLDPSQVLIGEQSLFSLQPRASSTGLDYTFLNNTPAVGLLVPNSKIGASAQLYSYQLTFFDPASNSTSTFSSAQLNAGGVNAVLPLSGPRISVNPNPSSLTANAAYPKQIVGADILEQAPYQLQYVDSGEVIRSQQNLDKTSKGFGLSQVAGRYTATISGYTGTAAGWLAIAQPFTPSADSNPAGRVWIQFTGLYPSSGVPPANLSPSTWLNALSRSNFNADAPNLPLLQNAQSQSSSGGLLIQADPTEGWGANLGKIMLVADLNGDGCDELIIGAPDSNSGGSVYIINGSWIQENLNSNPESLDLNNPDALGSGVVTVLNPGLAGVTPTGSDASTSQFGSALAFDGTTLYIGAPTYLSEVVAGDSSTQATVGAVYSYGPGSTGGTPTLSLYKTGIGGSLNEDNAVGVATTTYWGERLGSSLAASVTPGSNGGSNIVELAIGAPGLVAGLQYSGNQKLQQEQQQISSFSSKTAANPYGDGALLKVQLPSTTASSIDVTGDSSTYTKIASDASGNASEASAYMQRLKALMTDPIAQATTFYDQSLTANEIGAVYYQKTGATTENAVFYGASPWNTGSTGFGCSVAFADLTNSNANTLVIGADTTGGSGAAYFINPGQLPSTTLGQSAGANRYFAHLCAGLTLYGQNAYDHFGNSLVSTGDVNADPGNTSYTGYNDILINAYNAQSGMGIGYLLFGADNILGNPNDPAAGPYTGTVSAGGIGTISNNNGSVNLNILSESGGYSQENVGLGSFNASDVNGDGVNDILLGGRGAGHGYLTWGKPYLQDISNFQLNKLASDQGFILENSATTTEGSLRSIGDFNGDGYGDFYSVTPEGELTRVRVELGGSSQAILSDYLYNDFNFFVDNGTQILSAGDVNGDGFDDVALFLPQNLSSDSQGAGSTTGLLYGRPSETLPLGSGFGLLAPAGLAAPSQDIQYGLSNASPCFLAVDDTIYAVVKSYDDDSLWFSRSGDSGNTWASWVDISSQQDETSALPVSLAYYDNKLVLAYVNSNQGISLRSWDPSSNTLGQWSAPQTVDLGTASTTPNTALAPLLLNQGTELALYWVDQASSAITAATTTSPMQATGWSPATTLSTSATGTPILSATALAGTMLQGTPVLAYGQTSGSSDLSSIALISPDSGGVLWEQRDALALTGSVPSNAPGLAATGTGLALTYTNGDNQVVVNQLRLLEPAADSATWLINSNPQWQSSTVAGVSSSLGSAPVVVNDLLLVGTVDTNQAVGLQAVSSSDAVPWLSWMDSTVQLPDGNGGFVLSQRAGAANSVGGLTSGNWQAVASGYALSPPAVTRNGDTVYMAVQGTDNHLYWNSSSDNGQTWNNWQELPTGMGTYMPPSIAYFNNTLYLCYVAAGSQDLNITYLESGNTWKTQYQISGQTATAASMIVEGNNLAVYFVSQDSSDRILKSYTNSSTPGSGSWTNTSVLYGSSYNQTASGNLALTRYNGQTYIAYQGGTFGSPSNTIYLTTASDAVANGSSPVWTLLSTPAGIDPVTQRGVGLTSTNQGLVLTYTDSNNNTEASVQLSNADVTDWLPLTDSVALSSSMGYTPLITGSSTNPLLIAGNASNEAINVQLNGLNAQVLNSAQTGSSISALGDINGDGYDDLAITANNEAYAPTGNFADSATQLVTGLRLLLGAASPDAVSTKNSSTATQQSVQIASLYPQQTPQFFTPFASASSDGAIQLNGVLNGSTYQLSSTANASTGTALSDASLTATAGDPTSQFGLQQLFAGSTASTTPIANPLTASLAGNPALQTLGGLGDLNGDGYTDYLAPDGLSSIYTGDGTTIYGVWSIRAAGDVNGNGFDDVLLALTPAETAGQQIQTALVDGSLFKVVNNQFSLQQAQGSYETGWSSAGLKAPLNPYLYPYSDSYIPSLQVWFEPIQSYEPPGLTSISATSTTISNFTTSNYISNQAATVDANGQAYVASYTAGHAILLSYGTPASSSWTTRTVGGVPNTSNIYASNVNSVAIYDNKAFILYTAENFTNSKTGTSQLYIAWADLDNLSGSNSWTNYLVAQGSGGQLVNEDNRLALYYCSQSGTSGSSISALYSTDPSTTPNASWGSSLQGNVFTGAATTLNTANTNGSPTALTASSLAATRFQGKTVLAFYSGSYSQSNTTLTFAQAASSEPGSSWQTYASTLGRWLGTGYGAPQLSLTASSDQLYLVNGTYVPYFATPPKADFATGSAYDNWNDQISLTTAAPNVFSSFVSQSKLYLGACNSTGLSLVINAATTSPSTPSQVSLAGYSIDGNVDINADGYHDILISDPSNPAEGLANQYALFGGDFLDIANQIGTPSDDTLLGTPLADIVAGLAGSDRIDGNGGEDVIIAGAGDDQINLSDNSFRRIDGGAGLDTLLLEGPANQNWSFTEATQASAGATGPDPSTYYIRPGNRLKSVELISSVDYGANTLSFDRFGVQNLNQDQVVFLVTDSQDHIELNGFNRNGAADMVFGGARWNGFTTSDDAAMVFVLVPSSQTAVNSSGENTWLASHVTNPSTGVVTTSTLRAATLQPSVSLDPADDYLAWLKEQAGSSLITTDDYTVTAIAATEGGILQYRITRQGAISKSLAIQYSSTSDNGTTSLGIDQPAAVGILHLKPGETSKTITVPTIADQIAEGRKETASLRVQQVDPQLYPNELHLLIRPSEPVLLSGFNLDGNELQFHADMPNPREGNSKLAFTIQQRSNAAASDSVRQTTFEISDDPAPAPNTSRYVLDGLARVSTDRDGKANGQVSVLLDLPFGKTNAAAPTEPLVDGSGEVVDANHDGIADALQDDVTAIALLADPNRASNYGAIVNEPGLTLETAALITPAAGGKVSFSAANGGTITAALPPGISDLFAGVLSFSLSGLQAGASTTVELFLPTAISTTPGTSLEDFAYIKYNTTTARFEEFVDRSGKPLYRFSDSNNDGKPDRVSLTLKDGDPDWDGDSLANGTVIDPGYAATGQRTFTGNSKANRLTGNLLANSINGNAGHDKIDGGLGNDVLSGGAGDDRVDGGEGDDGITGGKGRDALLGGLGADRIDGGPGSDRYLYASVLDSTPQARDHVIWNRSDRFDLSAIDANPFKKGNQAFRYIAQQSFTGRAGELRATATLLQGDLNGDKVSDFEIELLSPGLLQRFNLIL